MQRLIARAGFLRTRVARQTLLHFLTAALIPAVVSSVLGIWYVRQTLIAEATDRVDWTAESTTHVLLRELTTIAKETVARPAQAFTPMPDARLSAEEVAQLRAGGVVLRLPTASRATATADVPDTRQAPIDVSRRDRPTGSELRLLRQMPDGTVGARLLRPNEIWDALDGLIDVDRSELCVFAVGGWQRLYCSSTVTDAHEQSLREVARTTDAGVERKGTVPGSADLIVAQRDIFLRFELASPEWRLVTSERRATALAPASSVTTSLALLIALATVGAFVFAHRQIRRDTMPLDALHAATRRVVAGDLQTPVIIDSQDEYGELASAFNGMTGTLSQQMALLRIMDEVDDATLRERDLGAIASMALIGLRQLFGLQRVSVAILDEYSTTAVSHWVIDASGTRVHRRAGSFTASDRATMLAHPRRFLPGPGADAPATNPGWLAADDADAPLVLPLISDGELLGAIAIDMDPFEAARHEDALIARRIADRVALGVANVRLLDRLDSLSSGTLLAFARAIDANSPWTAGHSERVTQLAISLGRQLGLAQSELQILYRGGLMHDIGKIGIPPHVLDKAGRLTDEERLLIETHPEIGEQILRPIPAFADTLSIVRSHHERFDGTGYPDRLAGDAIPWLARILAVADVFDALASDRPYRAGLSHRATITIIEQSAGTHFDPQVVDALLALEGHTPSALARQGSMDALTMRGAPITNTPHSHLMAVV